MSLTKDDVYVIRTVVQDSVKKLEAGVKDVRDHMENIESDMKTIRLIQGTQAITLRTVQTSISGLNSSYRTQSVLFEDLNDQLSVVAEAVDDSLNLPNQVRDHEERLSEVENEQKLLKTTVSEHSRKLRRLK